MNKNICLITIDSLRADHLGCYGYHRNTSPNIDKIAKKSMIFKNAFTTNTATLGSFFSIFTSKYPLIGLTDSKPINENNISFVERLYEKGYNTGGFNSNPFLLKRKGFHRGFSLYFDLLKHDSESGKNRKTSNLKNYIMTMVNDKKIIKKGLKIAGKPFLKNKLGYLSAYTINNKVIEWIDNNKANNFFLWIHYMDVHMPYIPAIEYLNKIGINYAISERKMWRLRDKLYNFQTTKKIKDEDLKNLIDLYDAEIRFTDEAIGKVINKFKLLDLLDNLTLIITADHGEEFLEHGGLGHSARLYDEIMRVPLILYQKGIQKPTAIETNVSHIDLAPTISNISNVSKRNFNGENLLKYADKEDFSRYVIAEDLHLIKKRKLRVIRTQNLKYIYDEWKGTHELYNLKKDPMEQNNLVNDENDVPKKIKKILKNHLNSEKSIKKGIEKNKISKVVSKINNRKFSNYK
jgi:arylsulfatase A-like enzyme